MMIYISLTTIPSRIPALHNTLRCLLNQTVLPEKIILNIPQEYICYADTVIEIPDEIMNNPRILVNRCKDYGPVTKITGLYKSEIYSQITYKDIILVVDDDRDYNPDMISNFLYYHKKYPEFALTVQGWEIEMFTTRRELEVKKRMPRSIQYIEEGYVDILGGCCGFLLTKTYCDILFSDEVFVQMSDPNDSKFYVDDVWISGFLTVHNIITYMIPNSIGKEEKRNENSTIMPLFDTTRNQKNRDCILFFQNQYEIW